MLYLFATWITSMLLYISVSIKTEDRDAAQCASCACEAGTGGRLTVSRTSSKQSSLVSTGRSCSRPPGC